MDFRLFMGKKWGSFLNANEPSPIRAKIDNMPILMLDPQRMRQIVFNLLGNAVKFTQKGFVEVRAEFTPNPDDETCGCFRLSVEDSGCGISKEDLQQIAMPYVQVRSNASSRHGGTGLGLAITRELANAMNGEMTVTSTLGKGTTFHITLQNIKIGKMRTSPKTKRHPQQACSRMENQFDCCWSTTKSSTSWS